MAVTSDIVHVAFRTRQGRTAGVESLRLRDVLSRAPDAYERVDFSLVLFDATAPIRHTVDFEDHAIDPRSLLRVATGQVHRWDRSAVGEADAAVLVVSGQVSEAWGLDPEPWRRGSDRLLALSDHDLAALRMVETTIRTLQADRDDSPGAAVELSLCAGVVATRVRRIAERAGEQRPVDGLTARFLDAVAVGSGLRSVEEVAGALGYSTRHLHRVVTGDTGRPPRAWLTEHVVLEAQRLLARSDLTAAAIAARLDFADPSHFARLFRRATGITPTTFRSQVDAVGRR